MLVSKHETLKSLLDSTEGIHLTTYLVNTGSLPDLHSQLQDAIHESQKCLIPVMTAKERKKFLAPLHSVLSDPSVFKKIQGNIGLFRNKQLFRIVNIPVEVEQSCHVATSFHVKPLLRWLQSDQEFLFIGLKKDSAHLYYGSQDTFKLVDAIFFAGPAKEGAAHTVRSGTEKSKDALSDSEAFIWLNERILELTKTSKPKLFIAGPSSSVRKMTRFLTYKNSIQTPVASAFDSSEAAEICETVRKILRNDSAKLIEKALREFRFAEANNQTKKNLFQISKAVVQGKVRKLIVTDELSIFGKIDPKSGGLAIHPYDLDHEDDCILDDLAQLVLKKGGEVIVARRDEIPKGRAILAILDDNGASEKTIDRLPAAYQETAL